MSINSLIICVYVDPKEEELLCRVGNELKSFTVMKVKERTWLVSETS